MLHSQFACSEEDGCFTEQQKNDNLAMLTIRNLSSGRLGPTGGSGQSACRPNWTLGWDVDARSILFCAHGFVHFSVHLWTRVCVRGVLKS